MARHADCFHDRMDFGVVHEHVPDQAGTMILDHRGQHLAVDTADYGGEVVSVVIISKGKPEGVVDLVLVGVIQVTDGGDTDLRRVGQHAERAEGADVTAVACNRPVVAVSGVGQDNRILPPFVGAVV